MHLLLIDAVANGLVQISTAITPHVRPGGVEGWRGGGGGEGGTRRGEWGRSRRGRSSRDSLGGRNITRVKPALGHLHRNSVSKLLRFGPHFATQARRCWRGRLLARRVFRSTTPRDQSSRRCSLVSARRCGTGGGGGTGGAYSFVACLSRLTIDHASLSRRSTVPTPNRDTTSVWALITLFPYIT